MDESSIWEFYVAEIQLRLSTACYLNSKAPWNVSVISINTHNRMLSNASGLSFFSLLKLSSLCCYVFTFWYLYLYFLHLFYITGHLYYVTVLKILFLRFKYRITTINGQDISVGNSMICSDTWNKHHEWCFKIVKRKIWDNFEMARVVFTPNITCKSCY